MPENSILDPAAVDSLRALSPDDGGAFLSEIIGIYLHDTPERIVELESALAAGDAPTVTRAAHTLKSSSENFGATALSGLAREIEAIGRTGKLAAIAPLMPDLKARFAEARRVLEALAKPSA